MTRGIENPLCSGNLKGITRLNIPDLCFLDGANGLHIGYLQTQYPAENAVAATFDRELTLRRAKAIGEEFRKAGVNNALGPVAGPLGSTPYGGRNWENFSPDPYLTGQLTSLTVQGIQSQGVNTVAKHFVGNEQEFLRSGTPFQPNIGGPVEDIIDDVISEAVLQETYALPFAEAVRAGLGGMMCSYNRINGVPACENPMLKQILRKDFNFQGFQVSDWGKPFCAVKGAYNATLQGATDINMPGGGIPAPGLDTWGNGVLLDGVKNGTVPESRLDEQVARALAPYYGLGQDQEAFPTANLSRVVFAEDREVGYDVAKAAVTLLKNTEGDRGLPLNKPRGLGLFGDAGPDPVGLIHFTGQDIPLNGLPTGYTTSGGGASEALPPWIWTPLDAFTDRARQDQFYLEHYLYTNVTADPQLSFFGPSPTTSYPIDGALSRVDTAMVFVTSYSREGYDRSSLNLDRNGDALIEYVASQCTNTIVVVNAAGPIDMSAWNDNNNVTAVIYHYFPGQDGGRALVPIVFGEQSPSGRLPFTIAQNTSDYDPSTFFTGNASLTSPLANLTNLIDYRYFDYHNITPAYEFGFGLSYTNFSMSDLQVSAAGSGPIPAPVYQTNETLLDSSAGLYDIAYKACLKIRNTGSVAASQVAQLYISYPDSGSDLRPVRVLRGFEKVYLQAGEEQTVEILLNNKDLAVWETERRGWVVQSGEYTVAVGASSRDLGLTATISR